MARNSDQLAHDFETENTGGLLSGLLAEEDDFDRRSLWRLGSWGFASVGAVVVAVVASQSSMGSRRDQIAALDLARQSQQIQSLAKESQSEARRFASAIDTLNGDRDRLYSRVTVLEQGLDSVTGAIARQSSAASPQPASTSASPVVSTQPQPAPQKPVAAAPAPVIAPVATAPTAADKPAVEASAAEPVPTAAAATPAPATTATVSPAPTAPAATATAAPATPTSVKPEATTKPVATPAATTSATPTAAPSSSVTPATPLVASKSLLAPPDAGARKLIEPEPRASAVTALPIPDAVASLPPVEDAEPDATTTPGSAVQRTEFGADIGGANSVSGLRALWRGVRKNKALATLRPIIVVKERNNGLGMQLRLVAGPLTDAAAAARICAALIESSRTCETAVFDGQRLSMDVDDPPPVFRPTPRRRSYPKRAAVVEEPRKPESTLAAFFGRR